MAELRDWAALHKTACEQQDGGDGMKRNWQKGPRRWALMLLAAGVLVGGGYLGLARTGIWAQSADTAAPTVSTVTIEPADLASTTVSASGNLQLVEERSVTLGIGGTVETINVGVGDPVQAGDVLLELDTTALERDVAQAQLQVESAKLALADLQTPATAAELAQAQAALLEAQENLAEVQAGPSAEEIAAAQSSLAAAVAGYNELQAGPSEAELTQLSADMKRAEIAVAAAQSAYDQIAWQSSAGMTSQAGDLQDATIDYEAAQAAYAEATAPASDSDLQSAAGSVQSAQAALDDLLNSPTAAEVASAQAAVADAEANLADVQAGATDADVQSAAISLQEALITLESAQRDLESATVTAPISGYVITLDAAAGVQSSAGSVVATLADPSRLQLEISVAESDIPNVSIGQSAEIAVDALPSRSFTGVVTAIAPVNDSSASAVSYPVTIQLTGGEETGLMVGMNAVAALQNTQTPAAGSWLVPSNALSSDGTNTVVTVVRADQTFSVNVTPGSVQGEWTIVTSAELQEGDQVVGSLSSQSNTQSDAQGGGMGGPPSGGVMPMGLGS